MKVVMAALSRLSGFAFLSCAGCVGMAYLFHRSFVKTITNNPLYIDAMDAVRQHKGAVYLLGEPIESKKPVLANRGMLLAGFSDVQVQVSGPKSNGIVFLKVIEGNEKDQKIKIDAIHLQVGKDYTKRLVIRASPEATQDSSKETKASTKETQELLKKSEVSKS